MIVRISLLQCCSWLRTALLLYNWWLGGIFQDSVADDRKLYSNTVADDRKMLPDNVVDDRKKTVADDNLKLSNVTDNKKLYPENVADDRKLFPDRVADVREQVNFSRTVLPMFVSCSQTVLLMIVNLAL